MSFVNECSLLFERKERTQFFWHHRTGQEWRVPSDSNDEIGLPEAGTRQRPLPLLSDCPCIYHQSPRLHFVNGSLPSLRCPRYGSSKALQGVGGLLSWIPYHLRAGQCSV